MIPQEADEQEALISWARMSVGRHPELSLLFHIPNGGKRDARTAAILQRQGVLPGVPDLFLPVCRGGYAGLFVEMKRKKGGRVSPDQRNFIDIVRREGYRAEVCRGFEEAKTLIENYLRGEPE